MNEKNIKDVIHLYLGCEVEYGYEGRTRIGKLVGNDERYGWQIFDPGRPFAPYHHVRVGLLKLLLRPLSSMTEEELKEWIGPASVNFTEHYCKKKLREISSSIYGLFNYIGFYGNYNSIPWLLSKGFDLFGLLDAGLAVDATKKENV